MKQWQDWPRVTEDPDNWEFDGDGTAEDGGYDHRDEQCPCVQEKETVSCDWCGKEELRYHYRIRSRVTEERLFVGSKCILEFNIEVKGLYGKEAQKFLEGILENKKKRRALDAIAWLAEKESSNSEIFRAIWNHFKEWGALSPWQMNRVTWRLKAHGLENLEARLGDFTVSIRKGRDKKQMEKLAHWQRKQIAPALSTEQKELWLRPGT